MKQDVLKGGSLFDGSGGFPLAGALCGITPVWASEIEPFPVKVTSKRFPHMKHLGDITKINGAEIEPVDVITFGSPCQDLSVAGLQKGLNEGERSVLFFEAIRIIKEMRCATNGRYPAFAVWENVPGAFSSNDGGDFREVLQELCSITDPDVSIPRPDVGWKSAGAIMGRNCNLAWRVLDAQFWGVPQRRRRIFAVADFGGQRAQKVLFERESLSRCLAQGGETREAVAEVTQGRARTTNEGVLYSCGGYSNYKRSDVAATQRACIAKQTDVDLIVHPIAYSFDSLSSNSMKSSNLYSGCNEVEIAKTLDTSDTSPNKNQGGIAIVQPVLCYDIGEARLRTPSEYEELCPTLSARCGTGGNNVPAICIAGNTIDRKVQNGGNGAGFQENVSYTLNTVDRHAVMAIDCRNDRVQEVSGTLQAKAGGGQSLNYINPVCVPINMQVATRYNQLGEGTGLGVGQDGDPAYTLQAAHPHAVATYQSVTGPLMANSHPGAYSGQDAYQDMFVTQNQIVRRLTPTECARLQGFPDWWCADIPHADSAEYKMWGNGVALPCVLYVLEGIAEILKQEVPEC